MLSGNFVQAASSFRDMKELCQRADVIMLDHQGRAITAGPPGRARTEDSRKTAIPANGVHGLGGWDKLAPESMATYGPRKAAAPIPEVRMWMVEGVAGTIQPWWHHVGGYQEDRRQFQVVEPFFRWYAEHQEYLVNRQPVATVVWFIPSATSSGMAGTTAMTLALAPYNGMIQALIRARIPYFAVHADHIERDASQFSCWFFPIWRPCPLHKWKPCGHFVNNGGSLIATDETSLYDDYGDPRPDFALADVFRRELHGKAVRSDEIRPVAAQLPAADPGCGTGCRRSASWNEPAKSAARHPVPARL